VAENDPENLPPQWIPEKPPEASPRSTGSRIAEVLLWFAVIGTFASVAIPTLAGQGVEQRHLPSGLIGFLLWPFLLARVRRAENPWIYPLAGLVLFFGLIFVGPMVRARPGGAETDELIAALEVFEPETARRARAIEKDPVRMKEVLVPAMFRAMQIAPDAALVEYRDAHFQLISTANGVNRERCADIATGRGLGRMSFQEQLQMARVTSRLIRAAAASPQPNALDPERATALNQQVMLTVDPEGIAADPARVAALSREQACEFYLRTVRAIRALPPADLAQIIRLGLQQKQAN